MSIKLELEVDDVDLLFLALQTAPVAVSYERVKQLLDKIEIQGRPQLNAAVVQVDEPLSAGGTD